MTRPVVLDIFTDLFATPLLWVLMLVVTLVVVVAVGLRTRGRTTVGPVLLRELRDVRSAIERGRDFEPPSVRSRQEIVTDLFASKLLTIGLLPASATGHIPVSRTPLAQILRQHGLSDDVVDAITQGIRDEATEEDVMAIVEAAAESPGSTLRGQDLERAKQLAVEEWRRTRGMPV